MTSTLEGMRARLHGFDLVGLLVEELGWNHHRGSASTIAVKGKHYRATPIAEKAGFVVWRCEAGDGRIPNHSIRRQIEKKVTRHAYEHLIVFVDDDQREQVWQWVKREAGKADASREYTYHAGQTGEPVLERLRELAFGLDEEEDLTISLVANRVKGALNAESVTKRFFEDFQKELHAFQRFVAGIGSAPGVGWYASLMLNRLMFIYFIQKRGFLDGDTGYLRNRLDRVRAASGPNRFHDFYRSFLRRLFHEGLGRPESERSPELVALLGKVPFLNGGIFDVHDLERDNPDIRIPDRAFERLFDFFDRYRWHLDERSQALDNEINPDVLGHIFEKSINQKEKGAYYTKEDVTGYMAESTIVPRLLDMVIASAEATTLSLPHSVLDLLRKDPDRYIPPAVGHGLAWDARDPEDPVRVDPPLELPEEIMAGVDDRTRRADWDQSASRERGPRFTYAHPRETWRQVVARRKRYKEVRDKLTSGGVRDANDLVTLNLDGQRLLLDAVGRSDDPALVRAFWNAATNISVLDPTCGSGAFLFAALRVLEPVYAACLARMRDLRPAGADEVLAELKRHPSERYFILKSIVLNNLYGVDIMKEAVEICKLRLFLKLVAQLQSYDQIEPLPDIDFNIRAGNALVGYASIGEIRRAFEGDLVRELALPGIEAEAQRAAEAFGRFQRIQTEAGTAAAAIRESKQWVRRCLSELRDELDRQLAFDWKGIQSADANEFNAWYSSHQPFHWCTEFWGVIERGDGFDVVIGNPPYIAMGEVRKRYSLTGDYRTAHCPDVYAPVVERSMMLTNPSGRVGMIVPLNLTFNRRFQTLRDFLLRSCLATWFSSFDRRPSKLFSGGEQIRNTIVLGRVRSDDDPSPTRSYTTRLHRWFDREERPALFKQLGYLDYSPGLWNGRVPKVGCGQILRAFEALLGFSYRFRDDVARPLGTHELHFTKIGYNWLTFCIDRLPVMSAAGGTLNRATIAKYNTFRFEDSATRDTAMMLLNGKLAFLWWLAIGDGFNVTQTSFELAPIGPRQVTDVHRPNGVAPMLPLLQEAMQNNVEYTTTSGKQVGTYRLSRCREVTDRTDKILLDALGLLDIWDDIEHEHSLMVRTDFGTE